MGSRGWKIEIGSWKFEGRGCRVPSLLRHSASSILIVMGLWSCTNSKTAESEIKFQQYFVQGEQLYIKHCSNCHQPSGSGLGRVYPPLNKSDFMDAHFEEVICLIKYGREGELIVNGESYIQPMPGVASLTDIEIAEVATYIYNSWEHTRGMVEVKEVSRIISECQ